MSFTPHLPAQLDASRTALLLMDYQPGILKGLPDPEAQLACGQAALELARDRGLHIGFVRVGLTDADLAAIPEVSPFLVVASGQNAVRADAPEAQVAPELAPRDGEIVVRKRRIGALSTTDLHEQLTARGVDTLVLAGISTGGVVLSTVRDAADRDLRLIVLSDASADPDPELHAFLLDRVLPRQASVLTTAEWAERLPSR